MTMTCDHMLVHESAIAERTNSNATCLLIHYWHWHVDKPLQLKTNANLSSQERVLNSRVICSNQLHS